MCILLLFDESECQQKRILNSWKSFLNYDFSVDYLFMKLLFKFIINISKNDIIKYHSTVFNDKRSIESFNDAIERQFVFIDFRINIRHF